VTNETSIDVRPCGASDRDALTVMYAELSTRSLYRRFFAVSRTVIEADIDRLARTSSDGHLALIATIDGRIVGVVSIEPLHRPRTAEVALLVNDAHQHGGIGGLLLREIEAAALRLHYQFLSADTLGSNSPMIRLLHDEGYTLTRTPVCGVVHAELCLTGQP
jgi:GNAT superfamily N-acetyltransferase